MGGGVFAGPNYGDLLLGVPYGGLMSDENLLGSLLEDENIEIDVFEYNDRSGSLPSLTSTGEAGLSGSLSPSLSPLSPSPKLPSSSPFDEPAQQQTHPIAIPQAALAWEQHQQAQRQAQQQAPAPKGKPCKRPRRKAAAAAVAHLVTASSGESADSAHSAEAASTLTRAKQTNRRAQKRYREKQKEKASGLESQVEALEAKLTEMQVAKDGLEARNSLLEKFVEMQGGGDDISAVGGSAPESWWLDSDTKRRFDESLGADNPLLMSREEVANMPMSVFKDLWKGYVNKFAALLAEAKGDIASPVMPELAQRTMEFGRLRVCVAISHPKRISSFLAGTTGENKEGDTPAPGYWREVAKHLNFSADQRQQLLALRRAYLHNMSVVVRRRQEASALLQASLHMAGSGNKETGADWLRAAEAIEQLKKTLCDEHACMLQFQLVVYKKIFDLFQGASAVVQSYPWTPDLLALANVVAEDAGAPPAAELLLTPERLPSGGAILKSLCGPGDSLTIGVLGQGNDGSCEPADWDCKLTWDGAGCIKSDHGSLEQTICNRSKEVQLLLPEQKEEAELLEMTKIVKPGGCRFGQLSLSQQQQ